MIQLAQRRLRRNNKPADGPPIARVLVSRAHHAVWGQRSVLVVSRRAR
jgi:hypothetical protein